MLHIGKAGRRNGHGATRRELIQAGGIGLLGITLADGWRAPRLQAKPSRTMLKKFK